MVSHNKSSNKSNNKRKKGKNHNIGKNSLNNIKINI